MIILYGIILMNAQGRLKLVHVVEKRNLRMRASFRAITLQKMDGILGVKCAAISAIMKRK